MVPYKAEFLRLALAHGVLRFGEFKLKSGRLSPYFFNLGLISSGAALASLGRAYAQALDESGEPFDALFGPAYKGIPLVASVALALAAEGRDVPYAYNRKEAKDHGEGGVLVGTPPQGRIVIVDDVLTAGTALTEAVTLLRSQGAQPTVALLALDRQEVGPSGQSTVKEMAETLNLRIVSLVTAREVMAFVQDEHPEQSARIHDYLQRYGVK